MFNNILDFFSNKICSNTLDCNKTYFIEITFDCQTKNPIAKLVEGTGGGGGGGGGGGSILNCADVKACLAGTTINGTPLIFGNSILIPVSAGIVGSTLTLNVGNQSGSINLTSAIQAGQTLTSLTNPSSNILVYTDEVGSSVNHTIIDNITASLAGNILTLNINGVSGSINLSSVMPTTDVQITSGSFNAATNILTLLESNGDIHSIDLSDFQIMLATAANGDITVTQGPLSFVIKQSAAGITYNNTVSGLTATTVQQAIDALAASLGSLPVDVNLAGTVLTVQVGSNSDAVDILSAITGVVLGNTDSVTNTVIGHRIATHTAVDNVAIDINETITSLGIPTLVGNILTLTFNNENGVTQTVTADLSGIVTNEIEIASGIYNASTNIITLTETNGDTYTINLSEFAIVANTLPNGDIEVIQEGVTKFVIPYADTVCSRLTVTSTEASTLNEGDVYMVICGGTHAGKKVKLSDLNLGSAPTAPIMGGAGTTTVTGVGTNSASLTGTYTSDGGSAITASGFVVYPSGASPYTIGSPFVMQYPDATLPSPITASPTNLAPTTDYCARPYATNTVGTSYGQEICFTTSSVGYVTNLSSNNISIVDLTTFTNVGAITGISSPLAGFIDDGYMYVGGGSNFVTRIYLGDNSMVSLNLGAQVGPMTADATHIYVGTGGTNTLHRINKATFTVDATLGGLNDNQSGVIVGGFLYVNGQASGTIYKIDLSTFTIVNSLVTAYSGAHRIATDGTYLYVTHYISNALVRINIATFALAGAITAFSTPYGIAIDGGFAYVGNNSGGTITKVDLSTFSVVTTVGVGAGPRYPQVKSGFLYMPCDAVDRVDKIDLTTFTNVGNVATGDFPCQFMIQQ